MKKLLLFFGLICMINLTFAQEMVTIHQNGHDFQVSAVRSTTDYPASNIQFWVGSGSNSIVAVFQWCQDETMGVAYGYRWNGTATVSDMLSAIDAADSRFTVTLSGTMVSTYSYQDGTYDEYLEEPGWLTYTINGNWCSGLSDALVNNGYFEMIEWGDCTLPTTNIIPATDPNASTDPVDASLPFSDLLYWVGSGSDSAEFIVNFANPDTAFAWGFLFNGSVTAQAMVDAIAAADPRFWTEGTPSYNGDIHFVLDNGDTLGLSPVDPTVGYNFWWANLNGVSAGAGAASTLHNGDVFKYGDMNSAIGWDPLGGYFLEEAWVKTPTPVTIPDTTPVIPIPEEATIDFNDILFWVGEGTNEAVMAVNWADTALAWGYRWNGTATVEDMMNHIAAADPRFSFSGIGYISDINYIDTAAGMTTTLGITPGNYWGSTNNGFMDMGLTQTLSNGDFEKWADPAAGVIVDSTYDATYGYWWYTYVYPMTIHPVTVPDTTGGGVTPPDPEHGPFCGAVGTEGCNAIAANDNQFVAWATGVVLTRGPYMITEPDGPFASFGGDTNAIGPATMDNTMDAVSLGDGGSALITFERPIRNGEGPDFAVFENSFNDSFLELAFVEVSSDGVHFVRFPATSLTPTDEQVSGAVGGVDPTMLNNLAGKFRIGYGTPFDLEELAGSENLDIDSIVYVRIIDVIGTIDPQYATYDAYGHIVNDPWPTNYWTSGYDLTGVGVIHQKPVGIENHDVTRITVYPNPCSDRIYVNLDEVQKVELYNMNGQLLEMIHPNDTHFMLDMQQYPAGMYLLKVGTGVQKIMKK